jgi:hypothetical protein
MINIKRCAVFSLCFISSMLFSDLYFYPSKETLERVVKVVLKKEKGAYIQLSDEDIDLALSGDNTAKNLFCCEDSNFLKSPPLRCKGTGIGFTQNIWDVPQSCSRLRSTMEPVFQNGELHDIYAPHAIESLARHDINYAVRVVKLLRSIDACLYVGKDFPQEERNLLFGRNHSFIPVQEEHDLDTIENECSAYINQHNYVVLFVHGLVGHNLIARLWKKHSNLYIFDIGSLSDSLFSDVPVSYDRDAFLRVLSRDVRILYTAAIIPQHADIREAEYIKCIKIFNNYWYQPDITEACINKSCYLEDHCNNVFHSQGNNPGLRNKGVNEVNSIRQAIRHYKFNPDDLIIKHTGRYHFKSDMFLRVIENTPEVDGYVTIDPRTHWSFSGTFGLRYHYFKEMIDEINLAHMESHLVDFERIVLDYMKKIERERGARILYLEQVDIVGFVNHTWIYHW